MKARIIQKNKEDLSFDEIREEGWYREQICFDLLFLKDGDKLSPTIVINQNTKEISKVREGHVWDDNGHLFRKLDISYEI